MATASDCPSAPVQSVNSVSWKESPERGGVSFSGISVSVPEMFFIKAEGSENEGVTKKRAWNKPADGVAPEVGAVMGATSRPAFSESARSSTKFSTVSLREFCHGSITLSQETSDDSWFSEEVVNSVVSETNSASNHEIPRRQWSPELVGGSLSHRNMTAKGSFSQALDSHSSVVEASPFNQVKPSSSSGVSCRDNTHRDIGQRGGSHSGHEPHLPRGPFRRNNSGPQLRGNGSSNHSHGSKRDKERWKHDWSNNHRSFGSRVNLAPQQRATSMPFIRGPVSNAPFIPPPPPMAVQPYPVSNVPFIPPPPPMAVQLYPVSNAPFIPPLPPMAVQPYGPPVFYNDASSFMYYDPGHHPGSLWHVPMVPFAPMFYPMTDPHLHSKIVSQIDYYFSDSNLVKDTFLRQKMDVDGWVPINLIANFKKIMELTDDVEFIRDALRGSHVVETQGEKVRRKGNWRKWIMPSSPQYF